MTLISAYVPTLDALREIKKSFLTTVCCHQHNSGKRQAIILGYVNASICQNNRKLHEVIWNTILGKIQRAGKTEQITVWGTFLISLSEKYT